MDDKQFRTKVRQFMLAHQITFLNLSRKGHIMSFEVMPTPDYAEFDIETQQEPPC